MVLLGSQPGDMQYSLHDVCILHELHTDGLTMFHDVFAYDCPLLFARQRGDMVESLWFDGILTCPLGGSLPLDYRLARE